MKGKHLMLFTRKGKNCELRGRQDEWRNKVGQRKSRKVISECHDHRYLDGFLTYLFKNI